MAGIDGKALLKKMKPRRTVDYFAPMGRWLLVGISFIFLRIYGSEILR
jgi:hypothetical protein